MPPNPIATSVSVNRLRPSPVRGQLEPYSSPSPSGWRYIQTTDTPDEFKVLLPPGTAAMYDYLLKLETYELTKKSSINWERLMQMRHLKDRMVRKCQRLGNVSPGTKKASRGQPFGFQSLNAPSDFRLKEMEKWFREQQKRVASRSKTVAVRTDKPVAGPSHPLPQTASNSRAPLLLRSTTNPMASEKKKEHPKPGIIPQPPLPHDQRSISLPVTAREAAPPPQIFSPAPLPVLLLSQREEYGLEPSLTDVHALEHVDPPPIPDEDDKAGEETSGGGLLRGRRSCIKRNSMSDLVKTVSWADAQELDKQISRYAAAAKQAQSSGAWSEVRTLYLDQIQGLENLHEQVREGLDQLRIEAEHLQRIEVTVSRQRETLETTFKDFEHKYTLFQGKVQQAITEATTGITSVNTRLELPSINETSS